MIGLVGVAAQLGTMFLLSWSGVSARLGWGILLLGAIPMILALVFGAWTLRRLNRQRIGAVAALLGGMGFRVTMTPGQAEQNEFGAPISHLLPALGLRTGATGIQWFGIRGEGPTALRLFEHEFNTGSGKSTQTHYNTIVAWPAGHAELGDPKLAMSPWFALARMSWLMRRTMRNQELKEDSFADLAKDWCLWGDANTGARFLTASVRTHLRQSPRGEAWYVGAGWVCCAFNGTLTAENLERFLAHTRDLLALGRR